MSRFKEIIQQNGLIDALSKRSKTQRIALFIVFFVLSVVFFYLRSVADYAIQSIPALLYIVFMCLAWQVLATALPKPWKYYAANFMLAVSLVAGVMGILTSPLIKENEKLLCTSISPDGAYVASGYQYGEEVPFPAKVFVRNTEAKTEGKYKYTTYQVYAIDSAQQLVLSWADNTTLVVNGEVVKLDWLCDG